MSQAVLGLVIKAVDQTRGVLSGIRSGIQALGSIASAPIRALGGISNALGKIGLAGMGIVAVKNAIGGLVGGLISGNAQFETFAVQFRVLFQSTSKTVGEATEKAKTRLAELAKFAAVTPFELPEVVRADKILLAFGLTAENTAKRFGVSGNQIRTTIGDVAAGTGVSFEEIAGTFGKFASGATGEAIRRFQELGIATREQMASWGLQFSKSGELLTPAREAFTILEKHVRAKYGGMMAATALTWEGMTSNVKDWMGATKRQLAAPIFEALKPQLTKMLAFLNSDQMTAWIDKMAAGVAKGVTSIVSFLGNVWRIAQLLGSGDFKGGIFGLSEDSPIIGALLAIRAGFLGALNVIRLVIGVGQGISRAFKGAEIGGFVAILGGLMNVFPPETATRITTSIMSIVGAVRAFASGAATAVGFVRDFFGTLKGGGDLGDVHDMLAEEGIWDIPDGLIDFQRMLSEKIPQAVSTAKAVLGSLGRVAGGALAVFQGKSFSGFTTMLDGLRNVFPPAVADKIALGLFSIANKARDALPALAPLKLVLGDILAGNFDLAFLDVASAIQGLGQSLGIDASPILGMLGTLQAKFDAIKTLVLSFATIIGDVFGGKVSYSEGVGKALDALKTFVLTWIDITIKEWQGKIAMIGTIFTDWIAPIIPVVLGKLAEWGGEILAWVSKQLPVWSAQLNLWISAFVEWVTPMIPKVVAKLGELAIGLLAWVAAQIPVITTQLVLWAQAFLAWLAPAATALLAQLPGLIDQFLTWIGEQAGPILAGLGAWAIQFIQWIVPMIPGMLANLLQIGLALVGFLINTALVIGGHLLQWAVAFIQWVIPMIPQLLGALGGLLVSLGVWLITVALPMIVGKLVEWAEAFWKWIPGAVVSLIGALGGLLIAIVLWVGSVALPGIVRQLVAWANAFFEWVGDAVKSLPGELVKIVTAITNWIGGAVRDVTSEAKRIGEAIINGVKAGIASLAQSLVNAAKDVVNDAINAAKRLLGISSPSKVFIEIGGNMTLGMIEGLESARRALAATSRMNAKIAVGASGPTRAPAYASLVSAPARATPARVASAPTVTHNWTLNQNNYGAAPSPLRSFAALRAWSGS